MSFRGPTALEDRVENAPSRWSNRLRIRQFDLIAETPEFPDHSCRSAQLGFLANRWATLLVADSLVQDLPDQTAEPMGNHSDGLIMPQTRHIATMENFEDAPFVLDRRVGGLIENAPHGAVALRRPVATADSCGLVVSGAGSHPGGEVSLGWKGRCCGTHLGDNLLRRIDTQAGHLSQPLDLVLVGTKEIGNLLVELANLLVDKLQLLKRCP